jgi:hypothetical protein
MSITPEHPALVSLERFIMDTACAVNARFKLEELQPDRRTRVLDVREQLDRVILSAPRGQRISGFASWYLGQARSILEKDPPPASTHSGLGGTLRTEWRNAARWIAQSATGEDRDALLADVEDEGWRLEDEIPKLLRQLRGALTDAGRPENEEFVRAAAAVKLVPGATADLISKWVKRHKIRHRREGPRKVLVCLQDVRDLVRAIRPRRELRAIEKRQETEGLERLARRIRGK